MTINDQIRELAADHYPAQIARALGVSTNMINGRLKAMGIKPLSFIDATKPTDGEWIGAVMLISAKTGIPTRLILAGSRLQHVVEARWQAFRDLLDKHPEYSIAGLARTSGFHHSSILHGLHRLGSPPYQRGTQARSRASGRVMTNRAVVSGCSNDFSPIQSGSI